MNDPTKKPDETALDLAPDADEPGDTTTPPELEELATANPATIAPDNVDQEG